MTKKTATIIVITRGFEYLNATLDSLLRQDFKALRIIVFYPSTNSNIAHIIKRYDDKRLASIGLLTLSQQAVNHQLDNLETNYFSIVDEGTVFEATWVTSCIAALSRTTGSVAALSNSVNLDNDGMILSDTTNFLSGDAVLMSHYFGRVVSSPMFMFVHTNKTSVRVRQSLRPNYPTTGTIVVIPEYLYGVRPSKSKPTIQKSLIRKCLAKTPLDTFLNSARIHKEESPEWEKRYLALYALYLKTLAGKIRLVAASRLLAMAVMKPGDRKSLLRALKRTAKINLDIAFSDDGKTEPA